MDVDMDMDMDMETLPLIPLLVGAYKQVVVVIGEGNMWNILA